MHLPKSVKILDRRFVPAGEIVIQQGCIGNRAFLIEKGKVEVFMLDRQGRTVRIAEVGEGSIIGEMAMLDGGVRSASIRTTEDSVLVAISAEDIESSIGEKDGLYKKMMKIMVDRLKDTNARMIAQNVELAELEEQAQLTVKNITLQIPDEKQTAFKKELVPLLDKLKSTLTKYQHI
jgi:CRP-like cAMP-binding protein